MRADESTARRRRREKTSAPRIFVTPHTALGESRGGGISSNQFLSREKVQPLLSSFLLSSLAPPSPESTTSASRYPRDRHPCTRRTMMTLARAGQNSRQASLEK